MTDSTCMCGFPWDSLLAAHHCEYPAGHAGPHQCACGEVTDQQQLETDGSPAGGTMEP